MQWTDRSKLVKTALIAAAVLIAAVSLMVSRTLVRDLSVEERNKMEVWSEAMRALIRADGTTDLSLVLKVINGNNSIPVIVLSESGDVMETRNISVREKSDSLTAVKRMAEQMRQAGNYMRMELQSGEDGAEESSIYICYEESLMLQRLAAWPYVQLGIVGLFIIVAVFALLASKRAEQNRVWVGLSRETAHQLGTPISSLMAWIEVLRENYPDDVLLPEMEKDICRLRLIAERFSKIGSAPGLKEENLCEIISHVVEYIARRASDKVYMTCSFPDDVVRVRMSAPLFEWVVENLCKNAIDAMSGQGSINIYVYSSGNKIAIDISDTGKGISKKDFRNVFRPGFTTKKRGWGLGLSLAKRIIEEYHGGKIYVKRSEPGAGTTFCIELCKTR